MQCSNLGETLRSEKTGDVAKHDFTEALQQNFSDL